MNEKLFAPRLDQPLTKESLESILQEIHEHDLGPAELAERLDAGFTEALEAHAQVISLGDAADDEMRTRARAMSLLAAYDGFDNKKVLNHHGKNSKIVSAHDYKVLQFAAALDHADATGNHLLFDAVLNMSKAYEIEVSDSRSFINQAGSKLGSMREALQHNPHIQRAVATAAFLTASGVASVATATPAAAADIAAVNVNPTKPSPHENDVTTGNVVKIIAKKNATPGQKTTPNPVTPAVEKNVNESTAVVINIKPKQPVITPAPEAPKSAKSADDEIVVIIDKKTVTAPKRVQASPITEESKQGDNVITIKPIPVAPAPHDHEAHAHEKPVPEASKPAPAPKAPKPSPTPEAPAPGVSLEVQAAQALMKINHSELPENVRNILPKNTNWNNVGIMLEYMIMNGKLTDSQALGPVANALLESDGLIPSQHQRGGPAFGIVQWEGGRRTALEAYAAANNKPVDDLYVQLDFMLMELERDAWNGFAELKQAKTSSEATLIFMRKFERPGIPHEDRRLAISKVLTDIYNEKLHGLQGAAQQAAEAKAAAEAKKAAEAKAAEEATNNAVTASQREKHVEEFTGWHHPVPVGSPLSPQYPEHRGQDYAVVAGTPFYAAVGGVVKVLEYNVKDEQFCKDAFNNIGASMDLIKDPIQKEVRITRTIGKDTYEVIYAHMSEIDVEDGQIVNGNDQIGKTGNSGCSTGDHAHFEIRVNGVSINPNVLFIHGKVQPMGEIKPSSEEEPANGAEHSDETLHVHETTNDNPLTDEQQRRLAAVKRAAELKKQAAAKQEAGNTAVTDGYLSVR